MLEDLSPVDVGLPAKFASWRPIQTEAIERGIYTPKRFLALAMPTGSGKSLVPMSIAKLTGWRTVILTSTKGLMDQYMSEFGIDNRVSRVLSRMTGPRNPSSNELVDIRGKSNYRCADHAHADCEDGGRIGCRTCGTEKCPYTHSLTIARNAQTVVTNYKYWLNINRQGSAGLTRAIKPNPPELLVLDEAHLAPEELASYLAIRIYEQEVLALLYVPPPASDSLNEWRQFAKEYYPTAKLEMEERKKELEQKGATATRMEIDLQKKYEALADKLDKIKSVKDDGWVCEMRDGTRIGRQWEFDPVWPGLWAERSLFIGIPNVILISATLRPKTGGLLGIKWDDMEFREWPRIFPANRSPIYSIPAKRDDGTEIRINYRTKEDDLVKWVKLIDEIIGGTHMVGNGIRSRLETKGIIHTVSYARQQYLMEHSQYAGYMIGNTSDPDSPKAAEVVHQFKQAPPPSILVSPSFSTGWDFPGDECEWQIITKIPFPNSKSKVMKERMKRDPQYLNYLAMQDLIQSSGRGMRHERDRCETFIVDASIGWFLAQNRGLGPKWFEPRKMARVPAPPPPLATEAAALNA